MTLIIHPIRKDFGAEISGIDLSEPTTTATKQELNALLAQYAVLVFRQQALTPPQFMAAAEIFGELMDQQLKKSYCSLCSLYMVLLESSFLTFKY